MNRIGFCASLLLSSNIFPLKYPSMTIGKFGGRMNTISFNVTKKCPNDNVRRFTYNNNMDYTLTLKQHLQIRKL
jgi:hypothetical protein